MIGAHEPMGTHLLGEMTKEQVAADQPVVILPLGATEQHGPHLPLGTDSMVVEHVAIGAARLLADTTRAVVAPTLPYGFSAHHMAFGATMTVGMGPYRQLLRELVHSLISSGLTQVFMLNGHGGNSDVINVVAREVAIETGCPVAAGSYWTIAKSALARLDLPSRVPGHAGAFETSIVLAIAAALVRGAAPASADVLPLDDDSYRLEAPSRRIGRMGYTDDPGEASAAVGAAYLDIIVAEVAKAVHSFAGESK